MSRFSEMILIRNHQTNRLMDVTGEDVMCWSQKREYINMAIPTGFWATLNQLLLAGFCCLFMLGCGSTEIVSPEIAEQASGLSSSYEKAIDAHAERLATALAAQKLTGEQTLETAQAIMAKLNTLEASLVKSESQQTGGDPKPSPESPAQANNTPSPLTVATPGTSSETLTELATRLYGQGVSVHMKTREELEAIDLQMQGVKSSPVQYQSRPTYQSGCPGGVCPVPSTRQRKGLLGWRR